MWQKVKITVMVSALPGDISNIDNYEDYVMLPALAGPEGLVNVTRQNNSETSGFDRGRCVLTTSCRNTALAAAWIDQMYAPLQSPQNNWGTYGEEDSFNIFEMATNKDGEPMLKHMDLGRSVPGRGKGGSVSKRTSCHTE